MEIRLLKNEFGAEGSDMDLRTKFEAGKQNKFEKVLSEHVALVIRN